MTSAWLVSFMDFGSNLHAPIRLLRLRQLALTACSDDFDHISRNIMTFTHLFFLTYFSFHFSESTSPCCVFDLAVSFSFFQ